VRSCAPAATQRTIGGSFTRLTAAAPVIDANVDL